MGELKKRIEWNVGTFDVELIKDIVEEMRREFRSISSDSCEEHGYKVSKWFEKWFSEEDKSI